MNASHVIGVVLRRLGVVSAIVKVRDDQAHREAHHGGQLGELNGRLADRTKEVQRMLCREERKLS